MTVAGSATSAPIRCPESAGYTLTPQRIHLPARRFQRCSPDGAKEFAGFLTDSYTVLEPQAVKCSHADDRPYGLVRATVTRDDTGDPGQAHDGQVGWFGRLAGLFENPVRSIAVRRPVGVRSKQVEFTASWKTSDDVQGKDHRPAARL